jgi:hypothetical protein
MQFEYWTKSLLFKWHLNNSLYYIQSEYHIDMLMIQLADGQAKMIAIKIIQGFVSIFQIIQVVPPLRK